MDVRVQLSDGDDVHDELSSLREWLSAESELRGRVKLERAPIQDGHLGALSDALQVALSHDGALTVLAGSVAVWLRQRRSKLRVKIINEDGSSQEITASGPAADVIAPKVRPRVQD
jgi:hypothetical protein